MSSWCFVLYFLLSILNVIFAFTPQTLVVVKDDFSKYTYSRFFKSLKRRGHKVTIKSVTDKSIKLQDYGESLYNNLILLSPSSKQIGDLSVKDVLNFIDDGNNILIGVDNGYSNDFLKKIADRCGIDIHSKNSNVFDHINYDVLHSDDALENDVILLSNWPQYKALISSAEEEPSAPVLYSGLGFSFKSNAHLTLSLLSGNTATYSAFRNTGDPIEKNIIASGNALSLIAALQTRKNARITFVGSTKMLSDEYFIAPVKSTDGKAYDKSGNEEFMRLVSAWTFGERGILRLSNSTHHLQTDKHADITLNPTRYRIKDLVTYTAQIEEYRLECDCYVPFTQDDVQFEFIRLDSFIREFLTHDNKGNFKIDFMLPDVFGVYKFAVHYQRRGWGYIWHEPSVSVRPFRHDEYQRFLPTAYPYYLGSASMVIGFIVFTLVFLFGETNNKKLW
eukprot:CAMPEP_0202689576 /NCGR_PEP_ID=MMETSP1385-20130828/4793_1 /ASSEMBLY_ACC=CAM_ASM_000861 /TAXON_ID=933848 /ORGANISM="Elphidium margaritaceum" /LENGTH=447 /DNA_ID=CAMNT_0049344719 /DNA_START=28 /DNA_END=1371 /DNA_ORIENTATION=-